MEMGNPKSRDCARAMELLQEGEDLLLLAKPRTAMPMAEMVLALIPGLVAGGMLVILYACLRLLPGLCFLSPGRYGGLGLSPSVPRGSTGAIGNAHFICSRISVCWWCNLCCSGSEWWTILCMPIWSNPYM